MWRKISEWLCGVAAANPQPPVASEEVKPERLVSSRLRKRLGLLKVEGAAELNAMIKVARKRSTRGRVWEVFPQLESAPPGRAACATGAKSPASKAEPAQAPRQPSLNSLPAPPTPPAPSEAPKLQAAPNSAAIAITASAEAAAPPAAFLPAQRPPQELFACNLNSEGCQQPREQRPQPWDVGASASQLDYGDAAEERSRLPSSEGCLWVPVEEFEQFAVAMAAEAEVEAQAYSGRLHRAMDSARLPRKWRSGPYFVA